MKILVGWEPRFGVVTEAGNLPTGNLARALTLKKRRARAPRIGFWPGRTR